jgi:hypothetical protein
MTDPKEIYRDELCPEITGKCRIEGIGNVFIMLTNKEIEHFNPIALLKKQIGLYLPAKTKVPDNVNNAVVGMKEDEAGEGLDYAKLDYYRKTLNFEEVCRVFYLKKAADAEQEDEKQLFLSLAGEVEKHLRILEIILEFTDRPETVKRLGNAERQYPEDS